MIEGSGVYIFGAIQEKEPKQFGHVILNGEEREIFTIPYKQIAAVAAKVDGDVLPDRGNLFAHQNTVSSLMQTYTLIPMSFGNVLHSEKDVLVVMEHLYDEFEKLFLQLRNKIEVGLKVIAKKGWIDEELKKDSLLNDWKNSQKDITDPATFYEQIELGERAQNLVLQLESKIEQEIYGSLLELAEAGKQNNTVPGKILLNAAFLVDLDNESAFDQRINDLYETWKDRVDFKYSGPWPAYNFVNIRLRIEG